MSRNLGAAAILALGLILIALILICSRYDLRVSGGTVARMDRWTGKITVCSHDRWEGSPWNYLGPDYLLSCDTWPMPRAKSAATAPEDNSAVVNLMAENLVVENSTDAK